MKVGDIVEKDGRRWVVGRIDLTSLPDIPPPVERIAPPPAPPVERNADGDSIEDMRAVQERFGTGSVEYRFLREWHVRARPVPSEFGNVASYRIAAKHAGEFNAKIHDWVTWRDAAYENGPIWHFSGETHEWTENKPFSSIGNAFCITTCRWLRDSAYQAEQAAKQTAKPIAPPPAPVYPRWTATIEGGLNVVRDDALQARRIVCVCVHGQQDAQMIAKALNLKEASKGK